MGAVDIKPEKEEEFICIISGTLVEKNHLCCEFVGLGTMFVWSRSCLLSSAFVHGLKAEEKRELSVLTVVTGRGKCRICGGAWDADGPRGEISCY